jgi:galactokinase
LRRSFARHRNALADFSQTFGRPADVAVRAPGRVNLIGEHTDYNGGDVLPMALPLRTRAQLARRADRGVHAATTTPPFNGKPAIYELGGEARRGTWLDYVQAVTQVLAQDGYQLPGFDLLIESDLPAGSGLSSSAALMVAVLRALRELERLPIDDLAIARLAHRGETGLVGSPVGVMDPVACSVGSEGTALHLNTRTLEYELVPLPDGVEIALIDSGISHHHASGGYRTRRAECSVAARDLGVALLTDLGTADLPRVARLPEPLDRRARHVITEHARVAAAVAAMRAGALPELGALIKASHQSMRDDFEVSLPDIDLLASLANAEPEVWGARLTGGGFGGVVLVLCRTGSAAATAARVSATYRDRTGRESRVLLPQSD